MDELKKISVEMNTQSTRYTYLPLFVVQEEKKTVTHDGFSDDYIFVGDEGDEIDEKDVCEECEDLYDEQADFKPCEDCGVKARYPVKIEWEFNLRAGVFLTAKACDDHIKNNHYHYEKGARSYAISAWRNPEMETVMKYLSSLSEKKNEGY